jgi:hypothetical protein
MFLEVVHVFHHLLFNNKRFHDCNEKCSIICTLCNLKCKRYHLLECKDRILSLKQYALLDKDNL